MTALKAAGAAAVLLVGLAGGLLPWSPIVRDGDERRALGAAFAGGVLLGAGLLHLLPDALDNFASEAVGTAYPLALALVGAAFLGVLLLERVVVAGRVARPAPTGRRGERRPRTRGSGRVAYVLLAALSAHGLVTGFALGAQRAASGAAVLLGAILAHKLFAAFALGVGFARAGFARRAALPPIVAFACTTPFGIVAGTVVAALLATHTAVLVEATFDALAAGTFLYVAAVDLLGEELAGGRRRVAKWLASLAGFTLMAVLAIWV